MANSEEELRRELTKARDLLNSTVSTLEEERR